MAQQRDEDAIWAAGRTLLADLVSHDDWLPGQCCEASTKRYRQYLLHCDSVERFCVVSFVWGAGQSTPIHDHTLWGMIGVLKGAEISERFVKTDHGTLVPVGPPQRLDPGQVEFVSPRVGDIHRVRNAYPDRTSISIHVYGGNIGATERHVYEASGGISRFVSGYSNANLPNFWGLDPSNG